MRVKREPDWSPGIARRFIFQYLALWGPIAALAVFLATFLLTPAYNASHEYARGGWKYLYGGPSVVFGALFTWLFWHRLTDRVGFSWMLTWTVMACVSAAVFTGVITSHMIRPLAGETRWVLSGCIVGVTLIGIAGEYLMERR